MRLKGTVLSLTGHRPDKLGGYSKEAEKKVLRVAKNLLLKVEPDFVVSGMALGWDTAGALAAIALDIPLIAAVPFEGQESRWTEDSQARYKKILHKAHKVQQVCRPGYAPWKMQVRNIWMLDVGNVVGACWDGSPGGTANCLKVARSRNMRIINVWKDLE